MAKIVELSQILANQIAAGEVIERPASVVKELVENAVDAGSTQIDILIEEAGLKKIQVVDNGEGIEPDDVQNAFKRHATSKIYSRDDLFRIRTLGFRGEALPSIASVSEVTVETSTGEREGVYLRLKGGQMMEERPNASRRGTKIVVENLFFNTPARLKYVKTLQTELANIGDIVNRLALSHPNIAFRLVHEDNLMLKTVGNGDLRQTLAGIYGVATAKKMRKIEKEDLDFRVTGYVSLPEVTRASRNYLSLIVNGRYIRNYVLTKAILSGYRSKLMVGRYPIAAIEIQMDPLLVDVNVHPTKQEVRISKEKELMQLIEEAIHDCLSGEQRIPEALTNLNFKQTNKKKETSSLEQTKLEFQATNTEQTEKPSVASTERSTYAPKEENAGRRNPTPYERGVRYNAKEGSFYLKEHEQHSNQSVRDSSSAEQEYSQDTSQQVAQETVSDLMQYHEGSPLKTAEQLLKKREEDKEKEQHRQFPALEFVGQMHGTYLFAQNEDGLYIVDQHAAQERIKYEYFRKQVGQVSDDLQDLLVPILLDYPNSDAIKIRENKEILESAGLYLEPFGQNSFLLRSHPTWFNRGEEEDITKEIIDLLLEQGTLDIAKFREATAIMMSCKRSIKANHYLSPAEAQALLSDLSQTENPYNCPHGRPVLIHFTNTDMEKMFKRIQDPH